MQEQLANITQQNDNAIKEKDKILGDKEELKKCLKEKVEQLQDQEALQKKYKELETEKKVLEVENAREIDDLEKKRYMRKISQDVFIKCLFSIDNLHGRV